MTAFTIYEKHPTADAYRVGGAFVPYALVATEKRFSDAELAAEMWKANGTSSIRAYQRDSRGNIIDKRGTGWEYEKDVMARFARLPHFDA